MNAESHSFERDRQLLRIHDILGISKELYEMKLIRCAYTSEKRTGLFKVVGWYLS